MCKLITCPKCNDIVNLSQHYVRSCFCGECGGRYLDDNITAVVNKEAIVVGIDNNGFNIAKQMAVGNKECPNRLDFFFTGWIPTKPGEVIVVDTYQEVVNYDFHLKEEDKNYTSTSPTEF
jgi:hypothetical protein